MTNYLRLCCVLNALLLSACSINPATHPAQVVIDERDGGTPSEPESLSKGLDKDYVAMLNRDQHYITQHSAVASLVETAERQQRQGQLEAAANTLERALRMSPRNPLLWHQFASLRYQQGDLPQALQLATKSNIYAGDDAQIQINNWRIIGHVKELQGDKEGARIAYGKVTRLQR